ncbi:unnamed protein product [Arabidopsis halleri]
MCILRRFGANLLTSLHCLNRRLLLLKNMNFRILAQVFFTE